MAKSKQPPFDKKTPPVFRILSGPHKGKQFRLLSTEISLGSDPSCDVVFKNNLKCSPLHARVRRVKGICSIESLDQKNLVLVNKVPCKQRILSSNDKVRIGNVDMLFVEQAALPSPVLPGNIQGTGNTQGTGGVQGTGAGAGKKPNSTKPLKPVSWLALLAVLAVAGYFLFLDEEKPAQERKTLELRTETQVKEELEALEEKAKKFAEEKNLSFSEKQAQSAFIKGFRDYGKGYFFRALKMFEHCLMVYKDNPLCLSYSRKSKTQIEKLIQKKVRLGKAYKENKQYEACRAVFKSVELMIQDLKNPVLKEARQNRKICEIQLKNRI